MVVGQHYWWVFFPYQRDKQTYRQTHLQTDRRVYGQTDRHVKNRQKTYKKTDLQTHLAVTQIG
jgi:hypothetical protein